MKLTVTIFLLLGLVACGSVVTKVTSSSPRTVAVQSVNGLQDAQNLANVECAKYSRFARWKSNGDTWLDHIFDCVE